MKKRLKIILALATAVSLFLVGCGGSDSENASAEAEETAAVSQDAGSEVTPEADGGELEEIHIGFPSSGADWAGGTLAVANEKGYLDEYLNPLGYKAVLTGFTGAAPAIHEALVSGDLDYADYAGFAGLAAKSNGIDMKLLCVVSYSTMWELVANTDSGVKKIEDLKGKKIGYQRGATPQMYVLKVLEEAGLTADDVELVNCTIPEGLASLSTGAVDATVVSNGQADELIQAGTAALIHRGFDGDHETYFEPSVLTGRTEYVAEHGDATVAIIEAMLKARDDIEADPDGYYELAAEKSGYPIEQLLVVAQDDKKAEFPLNLDEQYIDSLKDIEKFEIENEIITQPVDYDSWVDDSYVKQANEEYAAKQQEG